MSYLEDYFSHVRHEILPLLPEFAETVLEVGCGSGATLTWLKAQNRCSHTCGLEFVESAAEAARQHVDEMLCGDAEKMDLGNRRFDLILLLDVLEHLIDPWEFLNRVQERHLVPGGKIICSLPNIRHYRIVKSLLLKGEFEYQNAGILDRTHLRFFTRKSAVELMTTGNLRIEQIISPLPSKRRYRRLDLLTGGRLRDFFVYQYLISSILPLQIEQKQ